MGPETIMNSQNSSTNPDLTILAVPKLRDNRSNWSDYYPRIQNTMGAKGLWRHILGTATAPVPYVVSKGKPMLPDGKTPAMEDQIESKESRIIEFKKQEYLAKHILLSTTCQNYVESSERQRDITPEAFSTSCSCDMT
jgi:hypothetical protein